MKNNLLRVLAILIFSIGVLSGMAFAVAGSLADMESSFYGFNSYGNDPTTAMHCPVLLNRSEAGTITIKMKNTSDINIRPNLRFQVSNEGVFRSEAAHLSLEPGQSESLEWTVGSEDMVLNLFIFAKMFTFASYPVQDVEQTCGILVFDLPWFSGTGLTITAIALCLVGMGTGIFLWMAAHKAKKYKAMEALPAMIALAAVVLADLLSILIAWWLLGIVLSVLSLILVGVIIGNLVTGEKA